MSQSQLPDESDRKQKDFYINLRDKVSVWYEKNIDKKPDYADYVLLVPDFPSSLQDDRSIYSQEFNY